MNQLKILIMWEYNLISSANTMEMPLKKTTRARTQRQGILLRVANAIRVAPKMCSPYRVTLTRIGKRELDDHDNLRSAFKNIADGVCDALGIKNDRDRRKIAFAYAQEYGSTYKIRVEIEAVQAWRP